MLFSGAYFSTSHHIIAVVVADMDYSLAAHTAVAAGDTARQAGTVVDSDRTAHTDLAAHRVAAAAVGSVVHRAAAHTVERKVVAAAVDRAEHMAVAVAHTVAGTTERN